MSTCNQCDRKWESKAHVKHSFLRKLTIGAIRCSKAKNYPSFRWVFIKQSMERIDTDTLHFSCQHTM